MGEILGLGLSHFPGFIYADEQMSGRLKRIRASAKVPAELKDPANWPDQMRAEWSDDEGLAHARQHRTRFVAGVRRLREALDRFRPDVVVIFGDDQYENFQEDVIPPFCLYLQEEFKTTPFEVGRFGPPEPNVWGLPDDHVFTTPGSPEIGRYLAGALSANDMAVAYAYKGLHLRGLGHAFINTVMYLDYDQRGWTYPVIPVHVNSYGSDVVRHEGSDKHLFAAGDAVPDPPAPSPRSCFQLGRLIARIAGESDFRVAVVGSSSWSHAFLAEKNSFVYPDVERDRAVFEMLRSGDFDALAGLSLAELQDSGQHELLNWMPLFGAMAEVGRPPTWCDLADSYVMNSSKAFALFEAGRPRE